MLVQHPKDATHGIDTRAKDGRTGTDAVRYQRYRPERTLLYRTVDAAKSLGVAFIEPH